MKILTTLIACSIAISALAGVNTGTFDYATSNATVLVPTATLPKQAVPLAQMQTAIAQAVTGTLYFAGNGLHLSGQTFLIDPGIVVSNGGFTIAVVGGPTQTVANGQSITIPQSTSSSGGPGSLISKVLYIPTSNSLYVSSNTLSAMPGLTNTIVTTTNNTIDAALICTAEPGGVGNFYWAVLLDGNPIGQGADFTELTGTRILEAVTNNVAAGTHNVTVQFNTPESSIQLNPNNNPTTGTTLKTVAY